MAKQSIPILSILLLCLIRMIAWQDLHHTSPVKIVPGITGKPEYCLTCHSDLTEISRSHPVETFGCVSCHGGEPLALNAKLAHSSMRGGANPSDPAVVEKSCGGSYCHSGDTQKEDNHIQRMTDNLTKEQNPAFSTVDGFTGCAACHTPEATANLHPSASGSIHQLTIAIPSSRCLQCHSLMEDRSLSNPELARLYEHKGNSTYCQTDLACIDCHTRQNLMGAAHVEYTQIEAEQIRCQTCHGTLTELPLYHQLSSPEDIAFRLAFLNPVNDLAIKDEVLTNQARETFWNIRRLSTGSFQLIGKVDGKPRTIPLVKGSNCQQNPSEQEPRNCYACHAVQ